MPVLNATLDLTSLKEKSVMSLHDSYSSSASLVHFSYHFTPCFLFLQQSPWQLARLKLLGSLSKSHGWRDVLWFDHPCCPLPATMKQFMMGVGRLALSTPSLVAGTTTWVRSLPHTSDVEVWWTTVISSWHIRPTKSTIHHRHSARSGSEYTYILWSHVSCWFLFQHIQWYSTIYSCPSAPSLT